MKKERPNLDRGKNNISPFEKKAVEKPKTSEELEKERIAKHNQRILDERSLIISAEIENENGQDPNSSDNPEKLAQPKEARVQRIEKNLTENLRSLGVLKDDEFIEIEPYTPLIGETENTADLNLDLGALGAEGDVEVVLDENLNVTGELDTFGQITIEGTALTGAGGDAIMGETEGRKTGYTGVRSDTALASNTALTTEGMRNAETATEFSTQETGTENSEIFVSTTPRVSIKPIHFHTETGPDGKEEFILDASNLPDKSDETLFNIMKLLAERTPENLPATTETEGVVSIMGATETGTEEGPTMKDFLETLFPGVGVEIEKFGSDNANTGDTFLETPDLVFPSPYETQNVELIGVEFLRELFEVDDLEKLLREHRGTPAPAEHIEIEEIYAPGTAEADFLFRDIDMEDVRVTHHSPEMDPKMQKLLDELKRIIPEPQKVLKNPRARISNLLLGTALMLIKKDK